MNYETENGLLRSTYFFEANAEIGAPGGYPVLGSRRLFAGALVHLRAAGHCTEVEAGLVGFRKTVFWPERSA
jgi:hypothetical protein